MSRDKARLGGTQGYLWGAIAVVISLLIGGLTSLALAWHIASDQQKYWLAQGRNLAADLPEQTREAIARDPSSAQGMRLRRR